MSECPGEGSGSAELNVFAIGTHADLEGRSGSGNVENAARISAESGQSASQTGVIVPGSRIDGATVFRVGVRIQFLIWTAGRRRRRQAAEGEGDGKCLVGFKTATDD